MKDIPIKIYLGTLIIAPILFQYSIGIFSITLADSTLIFALAYLLISSARNGIKLFFPMVVLFIFVLLDTMVMGSTFVAYAGSIYGTAFRYLLYIFCAIFLLNAQSEIKFAERFYICVAVIAASFLFFQLVVFNIIGIYVPGQISFLPLVDSSLYSYSEVLESAQVKRFMAFFGEPSHFAIYELGALCILLFSRRFLKKRRITCSIFVSIAIIISTSILGVLVGAVLWLLFFLKVIRCNIDKIDVRLIIVLPIVLTILFFVISQTQAFSYITNIEVFDRQAEGRFSGFSYVSQYYSTNQDLLFFGNGMVDHLASVYLSGFPRVVFYFGILGCVIYVLIFFFAWKKEDSLSRVFLFAVILISTGSEFIFGPLMLPYYIFLICGDGSLDAATNEESCMKLREAAQTYES